MNGTTERSKQMTVIKEISTEEIVALGKQIATKMGRPISESALRAAASELEEMAIAAALLEGWREGVFTASWNAEENCLAWSVAHREEAAA